MKFEIWEQRLQWIVILAALAIRLAYFFQYAGTPFYGVPMWDADEYHTMAVEFSHGRLHPYLAYRPPLYPIILAVVYILFGIGPFAISMLQIAGGVYSAVLAQKIGTRLFGQWAGLGAGLATGLSGMMFYNDLELMPTSLETLLLLLLIWELVKVGGAGEDRHSCLSKSSEAVATDRNVCPPHIGGESGRIWLSGLWFGLGALTRAVLLPLLPVFLFWLWRQKVGTKTLIKFAGFAIGPIALSLIIHIVSGVGPSSVAAQGGINFYIGSRPGADGFTATFPGVGSGWSWETVQRIAEAEEGRPLTPTAADAHFWKKGRAEIIANPTGWLKLTIRKAFLFWNHLEISNNRDLYYQAHRYPIFGALMWLSILPVLPLAMAGAWLARRKWEAMLVVITVTVYYATVVPFFVNARFRTPLLPLLFVLAAGGAVGIWNLMNKSETGEKKLAHSRKELVGASTLLCLGLVIPWLTTTGIDPKRWDYGYFTEATALERSGRIDEAIELYKKALAANPRGPFINFNLGELARQKGRAAEAIAYFQKELELQPGYGTAWNSLGLAMMMAGDEDQALRCFEQAVKLRPDLVEASDSGVEILQRRVMRAIAAGQTDLAREFVLEAVTNFSSNRRVPELKKMISVEK